MKTSTRALTTAAALVAALGLAAPARAQAEDPNGYGDGYEAGDFGRVRSADAGATIVRAAGGTDERDRAGANAPIFPGDTVRTDGTQRVEIQLANGTIVRIDRRSDLAFQSLPSPTARFQDNSVLGLAAGSIRVTAQLGNKEEFRIDTPDASVYLLGDGEFRIDADPRAGTRVSSQRGVAEVVGNDSSVLVRGGTQTAVSAGSAPGAPQPYSSFSPDGFDRWCAARDEALRPHEAYAGNAATSSSDLPSEVQPYYGELSANGTWVTVPQYGVVWSPYGMPSGWQPYSNGYWAYGPGGYFWVSYEPWGWAPYHYGNWQWVGAYGWCWIPGSVFAGAWVSWSWGSLYVGWAPLDYWGRPGWMGGPYYYGYYDPGCWNFVDYGYLGSTNVQRYAVPVGQVGDDLRHATVVSRAPRVDPRKVGSAVGARERALREVANDHPAQMRPIDARTTPTRTLQDAQNQIARRTTPVAGEPARDRRALAGPSSGLNAGGSPGTPNRGDRLTMTPRQRRIIVDPRATQRPSSPRATADAPRNDMRDGVRDLYQRMSRPRESREQAPQVAPQRSRVLEIPQRAAPPRAEPQRVAPQPAPQRATPQRAAPPRAAPQRATPPPAPQKAPARQAEKKR